MKHTQLIQCALVSTMFLLGCNGSSKSSNTVTPPTPTPEPTPQPEPVTPPPVKTYIGDGLYTTWPKQ